MTVQSAKTFPNKGNITVQLLAPQLQRFSQKDLILETSSCILISDKVDFNIKSIIKKSLNFSVSKILYTLSKTISMDKSIHINDYYPLTTTKNTLKRHQATWWHEHGTLDLSVSQVPQV